MVNITSMSKKGSLIIIGGSEEREEDRDRAILREIAAAVKGPQDKLAIITVASSLPEEMANVYEKAFKSLGVKNITIIDVRNREDSGSLQILKKMENVSVFFFTGGDQLRITSQLASSPVYDKILESYLKGALISGTSAGAAAMPETMIFAGNGDKSERALNTQMAPGLGLINGVVIDSHFAERGRFWRLLRAIARNPKNLGIGIDENTAIVVTGDVFRVIGSGAVYVLDASNISYSSIPEEDSKKVTSIFDIRLHVLAENDQYDLIQKKPSNL